MNAAIIEPAVASCRSAAWVRKLPGDTGAGGRTLTQHGEWETLLIAANAGDGRAFARFLTLVEPTLRGIIRARGGALAADQHEDILQDVLLAIHLKRHTWRSDCPVRPWLYAVARHKVIDAFRRRGAHIHLPIEDVDHLLSQEATQTSLAARDTDRLLAGIDDRSAALVRAVALEGETAEEVGARLGLTAGAARVALHRAMKRLSALARRMNE